MKRVFNTLLSGFLLTIFVTSVVFSQTNYRTNQSSKTFAGRSGIPFNVKSNLSGKVFPETRKPKQKDLPIPQSTNDNMSPVFFYWASIFSTPYSDFMTDMTIDNLGNTFVTGFVLGGTMITIKYNIAGDSEWVQRIGIDGRAIGVDGTGNVYVAGYDNGAAVFKFSPSGVMLWEKNYTGPGDFDYFTDLAIDASGNIFLTGFSGDVGVDMIAVKYNSDGVEQWFYRYAQPENFDVFAFPKLAMNSFGDIFITDALIIDANLFDADYVTVKLNSAGIEQWERTYDGGALLYDGPSAIAVDNSGNVAITGGVSNTDTTYGYGTVKYNSGGNMLWNKVYNNSFNGAVSIKFDNSGNVIVTGSASDAIPPPQDYVTIKYDLNGNSLWVKKYQGIINSGDEAFALAIDNAGNSYVTGATSSLNDLWWETGTVSYDPSGNERWIARYRRNQANDNYGFYIAVSNSGSSGFGDVTVAGRTYDSDPPVYQDFLTLMYTQESPLPVELSSFTSSVNVNEVRLTWSTSSELNNSGFDVERESVNSSQWIKSGFIQGAGTSTGQNFYAFTDKGLNPGKYKYRLKQTDYNGSSQFYYLNNEVSIGTPEKFSLSQNYPNPFNPSTNINYELAKDGEVSLKLFDISGREVATLVNEIQSAGYYTATFNGADLSSGIYFYKLQAESFTETKRMILIK